MISLVVLKAGRIILFAPLNQKKANIKVPYLMYKHVFLSLLNHLAEHMKACGLWSLTPICDSTLHQAMTQGVPFACNVMTFEQWLQFVFIPKMTIIIKSDAPMPNALCLLPAAEGQFCSKTHNGVLQIIADIDAQFASGVENK